MRQKEYTIGKIKISFRRKRLQFHHAVMMDVMRIFNVSKQLKQKKEDFNKTLEIKRNVKGIYFNLNFYSEHQSIKDFRFPKKDVYRVSRLINFSGGQRGRNRYFCDELDAGCIVIRCLSTACLWRDIDLTFGMRDYSMSEIFWEATEAFIDSYGGIISTFRSDFRIFCAGDYANVLHESGSRLQNFIGFIDCTKISMQRRGVPGRNQQACYSLNKQFHLFIYQTITNPDGLIFYLYGPEVVRRHDLTLYRQSH